VIISSLSSRDALGSIIRSLRLAASLTERVSDELIAQSLRRAVYIEAPCLPHALARATREALAGLGAPDGALENRVEEVMESLIAYGDILEMRVAGEDRWESDGTLELRAAPPAFVLRKNKSVVLLGVAGDEITPLPSDWDARIQYRGVLRIVTFEAGEDARALLREMGLFELPEAIWLRLPPPETPAAHIKACRDRLAAEPPSTPIEGLQILDTRKPPTYYRGRWTEARSSNDGFFIARRPQRYGAPRWCIVDLERGTVRKFKDLFSPGDRIRPCDLAWRLQAALDAELGTPQLYRCGITGGATRITFYSPLPCWAERRLAIMGDKVKPENGLYAFDMPAGTAAAETGFLREMMWMAERADGAAGGTQ
jgi:hypothetical protein